MCARAACRGKKEGICSGHSTCPFTEPSRYRHDRLAFGVTIVCHCLDLDCTVYTLVLSSVTCIPWYSWVFVEFLPELDVNETSLPDRAAMAPARATAADRMATRQKLIAALPIAAMAVQTASYAFQALDSDNGGDSDADNDSDAFGAWSSAMWATSAMLLVSAAEPLTRRLITYAVGPERYSFARIEREFGSTASCKSVFRFELEHLRLLYHELRFPPVVRTHNATATGEEAFLYMIRRLSYPTTLSRLAWESGRSPAAQSELFEWATTHVYEEFVHLRDNRSVECWGPHFEHFAALIKAGGRKGPAPLKNCVGYVDGSNQKMDKPRIAQHEQSYTMVTSAATW